MERKNDSYLSKLLAKLKSKSLKLVDLMFSLKVWCLVLATVLVWFGKIDAWAWVSICAAVLFSRQVQHLAGKGIWVFKR